MAPGVATLVMVVHAAFAVNPCTELTRPKPLSPPAAANFCGLPVGSFAANANPETGVMTAFTLVSRKVDAVVPFHVSIVLVPVMGLASVLLLPPITMALSPVPSPHLLAPNSTRPEFKLPALVHCDPAD